MCGGGECSVDFGICPFILPHLFYILSFSYRSFLSAFSPFFCSCSFFIPCLLFLLFSLFLVAVVFILLLFLVFLVLFFFSVVVLFFFSPFLHYTNTSVSLSLLHCSLTPSPSPTRFTPYEWQNPHPCDPEPDTLENQFTILNCLWFAIGSLMQQGCDFLPQ